MSRPASRILFTALGAVLAIPALAQYPGRIQKKTDAAPPLRATAIYEWTGDLKQPNAGRLVPLAVWDGQDYQPGALYLAQPAPLSLLTGTVYELQDEGSAKALFTVREAENINGVTAGNWWIGIGTLKLDAPAPKTPPLTPKHSAPIPVKEGGSDSDRPVLHRRDSGGDSSDKSSSAPAVDPDRPTLHRKDTSGSGDSGSTTTAGGSQTSGTQPGSSGGSTTNSTSSDPDRPTLHRKDGGDSNSSAGNSGAGNTGSGSSAPPVDPDRPTMHRKDDAAAADTDPDRPTLHRRSDSGGAGSPMSTTAPIDPDRPRLRHGMMDSPTGVVEPAKLEGLPADMKQLVGVSDAQEGAPHSFVYSWADPADAGKMQSAMEDIARKALQPPAPQNVTATATKSAGHGTKPAVARKKTAAAAVLPLEDESFHAFELSYSGGATLAFTAKTTDAGGNAKYITLIAQPDFYGTPQVIFKQITSDDQLEITPRMLLVDALDTDADNRAELIFELRGKTTRAFAIYSIVNRRAEEAFNTGILPRIR